jgi:predicted GNAT family acetyltransferase
MKILQKNTTTRGMFYVEQDSKIIAAMTYSWMDETLMVIEHTEVGPELKGKNAGKQMLSAAVEYARKNNIKILPICPFAKSVFDKVEAYADVFQSV